MNLPIKSVASKVVSTVQNKVAERKVAQQNFKNRKDNTNYYKGSSYWKNHTN